MNVVGKYNFLLGYRAWYVSEGLLKGPVTGAIWPTDKPYKAQCIHRPKNYPLHRGANALCQCGFHGLYNYEPKEYVNYGISSTGNRDIWGAILAWGQIQFHENSFRAEFARPVAFIQEDIKEAAVKRNMLDKFFPKLIQHPELMKTLRDKAFSEVANNYQSPLLDESEFKEYLHQLAKSNKILILSNKNIREFSISNDLFSGSSLSGAAINYG